MLLFSVSISYTSLGVPPTRVQVHNGRYSTYTDWTFMGSEPVDHNPHRNPCKPVMHEKAKTHVKGFASHAGRTRAICGSAGPCSGLHPHLTGPLYPTPFSGIILYIEDMDTKLSIPKKG